jgi:hypothetical protein
MRLQLYLRCESWGLELRSHLRTHVCVYVHMLDQTVAYTTATYDNIQCEVAVVLVPVVAIVMRVFVVVEVDAFYCVGHSCRHTSHRAAHT